MSIKSKRIGTNAGRRVGQALSLLRSAEPDLIRRRIARRLYQATGAGLLESWLQPSEVIDSDQVSWPLAERRTRSQGGASISWVITPPGAGSGGHTTVFRMVEALERAGHHCTLYLHDRHLSPISYHESVIRQYWPAIRADVRDVHQGIEAADAYVATSWQTAHVLAAHGDVPGCRFYFVQDYEPYFYPRGSEYLLSEDTYRFGFRIIAIGGMVAGLLRSTHQLEVDRLPFGCDDAVYRRTNIGHRNGVVFYARPDSARRGFLIGMAALEQFSKLHPEQEIHLFGDGRVRPTFDATVHGTLPPAELAKLYNNSLAGISLSFTNISLVPYEMLACGTVPIANESRDARAELVHPEVRWCQPAPGAIARELSTVVESRDQLGQSDRASRGLQNYRWQAVQEEFVQVVENELFVECRCRGHLGSTRPTSNRANGHSTDDQVGSSA